MTLGALPRQVVRMILGQALRITLAGLVCGIAAALGLTHLEHHHSNSSPEPENVEM